MNTDKSSRVLDKWDGVASRQQGVQVKQTAGQNVRELRLRVREKELSRRFVRLSGRSHRDSCVACCACSGKLRLPASRIRRALRRCRNTNRGTQTWRWSGRLAFFLSQRAEFVAHLANGPFDSFDLDKEIADLFEEIVKMEGAHDIRCFCELERADELASRHFRNEIECADATALVVGDAGKFAKRDEGRRVETGQCDVGDDERPFPGLKLREEQLGVLDQADAPAFGIEDLTQRTLVLVVVIQDEDADLLRLHRGKGRH